MENEKKKKKKKTNWKNIAIFNGVAAICFLWWGLEKSNEASLERGRRVAAEGTNMDLIDLIREKK